MSFADLICCIDNIGKKMYSQMHYKVLLEALIIILLVIMPRLSREQRIQVQTLREEGISINILAERFNVDRRTILRLGQRVRETGRTDDRPREGRPRISSVREDRILRRIATGDPQQVARTLRQRWQQEHNVQASTRTVARRLCEMGLPGRIAKKKPLLTQQHRRQRLQWARDHQNWTLDQWRNVLFTDETPIHLIQGNQRRYVRRQAGQALQQGFTRPTVHRGGGRMVWGAFSGNGLRILHTIEGTINTERYIQILQQHVIPLNLPGRNMVFQQDNATPHKSRRTLNFIEENGIELLSWPPQSPDLSPIENLWSFMKGRLEELRIGTTAELIAAAHAEWAQIPNDIIERLMNSMPERIQAVITARGGPTRF